MTVIPLPVPNWASAEAQFIPNFSLYTKFFIGGPFEAQIMIWRQIQIFPNYPPPDHNLSQILNSDLASSYFPLKLKIWLGFAPPNFLFFSKLSTSDHNLGQILNSDLASSYFPLVYIIFSMCADIHRFSFWLTMTLAHWPLILDSWFLIPDL